MHGPKNKITFGEQHKSKSSSLCILLHSPVTSSVSDPNILLNTLFSNNLSLCSSLSVRGQVSYPYKKTGCSKTVRKELIDVGWEMNFSRRESRFASHFPLGSVSVYVWLDFVVKDVSCSFTFVAVLPSNSCEASLRLPRRVLMLINIDCFHNTNLLTNFFALHCIC